MIRSYNGREVSGVQNGFLKRRIGVLLCMCGMVMILAAVSYQRLEQLHSVAASADLTYVLVIDPGHGGDDGGAASPDGVLEADLNLMICKRLNALSRLCGIKTVMTRAGAAVDYPPEADSIAARKVADQKQRVSLIQSIPNAILLSVHQNHYPAAQPHGAQVLYAATPESAAFAELLQEQLVSLLDPQNRRVAAPISEDIYLMKNITCPGVLVECGFLSNPEECARLQSEAYQLKLSMTILSSYLLYFQNGCQL